MLAIIENLIKTLCSERGELPPEGLDAEQKAEYFRALCNLRPPSPIGDDFLQLQDQYLQEQTSRRGVVDVACFDYSDAIALWQGDVSRLNSDAIVNACNSALLGCFQPLHNCIDNIIHSNAGVQVRLDCQTIMQENHLPTGELVITPAYNLPSTHIFHTVGPIVGNGSVTDQHAADLRKCYRNCVNKAIEMKLDTLSICCLSTGVFGYPQDLAAKTAVATVRECLHGTAGLKVIFNVFLDADREYYEQELSR